MRHYDLDDSPLMASLSLLVQGLCTDLLLPYKNDDAKNVKVHG